MTEAETTADIASEASADAPDGATDPHPLDGVLRLNHLQLKGTHNSYHLAPPAGAVPQWRYSHAPLEVQLESQAVRQVELDVHWTAQGVFAVHHVPAADPGTTCATLAECLGALKGWSDAHPGHLPLFVLVEPKDDVDKLKITGHYDALDAEVLAVWPRERLFTPDDLRGAHPDLKTALQADGWPSLGVLRDRAMLVMLDEGAHRAAYLEGHPSLAGRVLFARGGKGEPWGAVLEHGNPVRDAAVILEDAQAGYLVRTTADEADATDGENQAGMAAALASGAHLISSDFPAPVEGREYWFDLPGGVPARCNPLTAPAECWDSALEALTP